MLLIALWCMATPRAEADSRTAVHMSPKDREFVLERMRNGLHSIQLILEARADGNRTRIAEIAQRFYNANMSRDRQELGTKLPDQWRSLGTRQREQFKTLADLAKNSKTAWKSIDAHMPSIVAQCVACHQLFRIEVSRWDGLKDWAKALFRVN